MARGRGAILRSALTGERGPRKGKGLEGAELARRAADELSEKQADAIVVLDIGEIAGFADYFVIATAQSPRQFEALAETLEHDLPREGARRPRREGTTESGWLLFDYGDVIVHLFGEAERQYYNLERLWAQGKQLLRIE